MILLFFCVSIVHGTRASAQRIRPSSNQQNLTQTPLQKTNQSGRTIQGRVIPTTSNPTINLANGGSRIVANTSFELQASNGMICESLMRGWLTTHPVQGACRVFEVWTKDAANDSLVGNGAPDGTYYIELNAFTVSMAYQPICMVGGEEFDFEFYHHVRSFNDTNTIEFRFGIPSGLAAGSKAADSYSRQVMRGENVQGANGSTATASITTYSGTTGTSSAVLAAPTKNWVKFAGTHTIDAAFGGVRNLGFFGILPAGASANLVDKVTVDLIPLVDLGASRDQTADEQGSPSALKIRINGRVSAGTKLALRRNAADPGDAVSDTDFSLGAVSAGVNGTASVTHTPGSNLWLIEIPAGDYDGGLISANNQGGLTIPVTYAYDMAPESTEYAFFEIAAPGQDGSTDDTTFKTGDPICDGSTKTDGVVYTITNVNPTNTPTLTPTSSMTPSLTPTFTATRTPSGQSITFPAVPDKVEGTPAFTLAATSTSGLPITYTSNSPSVCAVVGNTVTIIGPGDCSIDADQPGGTNAGVVYTAASTVNRVFKVTATQWITFPPISSKVYTLPDLDPSAVASSTLPVTLTSTTPAVCTIVSGKIHYVAPGTCSVTASQAGGVSGGVTYAAAVDVIRSFPVLGVPQAITFPALTPKFNYDPDFDLAATADSGLPITYTSSNPSVCTVTGKKVSLFAKGTCTITASQPGGTIGGVTYAAATSVVRSFPVSDNTPTPSKTNLPTATITNTPTNTRTLTPTPIPNLLKKSAVGSSFVLGLLHNGNIITWGMNKEYQTNIPPCCGTGISDVAVGTNFALALKGGRVYAWGANTRGQLFIPKAALSGVTSISAGYAHGLALKSDGSVVCWGNNFFGQCDIPVKLKGMKQVAGGQDHTIVRLADSTVKGYGNNTSSQISIPPTLGAVTDITAGCDHSMAIKSNGTVVAWGGNKYQQSKVPLNLKDVKSIAAGCHYSMALMQDGTLFGWGRNENKQVSIPKGITNAFSIGVGYVNSIIGLRDGSIIAIGAPEHGALVTRTPTP